MKVIIAGGGRLGYSLARNLIDRRYDVSVIEISKQASEKVANELQIEVICGDATNIETLNSLDFNNVDCFIAVTGRDQDNIVASQLAKNELKIPKVIARANNPRNLEAMRKLDIDIVVSSTEIITKMIEQEVVNAGAQLLATLNRGKAAILSFTLPENSALDGYAIKDIKMPASSLIVSVVRGEQLYIPRGDTVIYSKDEIVIFCGDDSQKSVKKLWTAIK